MRFKSRTTGAILEPRCEAVEAALAASPDYEAVRDAEEKETPKGKPKGAKSGQ